MCVFNASACFFQSLNAFRHCYEPKTFIIYFSLYSLHVNRWIIYCCDFQGDTFQNHPIQVVPQPYTLYSLGKAPEDRWIIHKICKQHTFLFDTHIKSSFYVKASYLMVGNMGCKRCFLWLLFGSYFPAHSKFLMQD